MTPDNQYNKVIPIDIEREVKKSFLEYSMSVIVSRALPDVRDGLKPVHRRILYALYDQGMTHDKPHKKSANIVGEVMGKYHPHGDAAIYQTMVKMAQPFSMRYPLIDGHGNFGSIDGDAAAAMRYTESRMERIASEMLKDIEKDTIDWRPNYDDTREEPQVLPARIPNLLINGSAGIAVGMATNIPPHNLGEIVDGMKMVIDNPEVSIDELMEVVPGPDFPTAGIMGNRGIREAYTTGRGSLKLRARYRVEEKKNGRNAIIVTEVPYQVNKARVVERIANLVKEKRLDGIVDLRDESDRNGIRVVIETRRDVNPEILMNNLYKRTQLEDSFGVIMLSLVNGQPKILNLKQMMEFFIQHRQEVITRRTNYELKLARNRLHILEGLQIALDNLDEVINLIRGSVNRESAREGLITRFNLSEIQANGILDMRLVQLTGLERAKLEEELRDLVAKIADLEDILARPERVLGMVKEDLDDIKSRYGDKRRTEISLESMDYEEEDFIEEHDVVITLSHRGYIKRQPLDTYKAQKRGGKGISSTSARAEDFAHDIVVTGVLANVFFFTNQGRVFCAKAYQIPESSRHAKGLALANFLELKPGEKVTTIVAARSLDDRRHLIMATKRGIVKKVRLSDLTNIRKSGIIAMHLGDEDELVGVIRVDGNDRIMLVTSLGKAIIFNEQQVRSMGRAAGGLKGMRLDPGDYVIGVDKDRPGGEAFLVTENGYGKRTPLSEYRTQNRGGKGLKTINVDNKNGPIVGFKVIVKGEELVLLTSAGQLIRLEANDISTQKRYSRGVVLMKTSENDRVAAVARFKIESED
ncbi:MAG: DNA gyrase subunit A [Syntrophomonadaceae bacterium]|nr:DNA gyrase subunit A [Syntrophomonadaceae bacterium]